MINQSNMTVRDRQDPLRKHYQEKPQDASISDRAKTSGGSTNDPFHGMVQPGKADYDVSVPFGIHRAIGGYHDAPNPGDLLCAALAACLDSTFRIIANRMGISLTSLEVEVVANVDVRGTLLVDRTVQVGFQKMQCHVNIQAAEGTDPRLIEKLAAASEYSCVVWQTLRDGVSVETSLNVG
ncbi:MAG: OsmC family protein [Sedimenticola sp.]|uniref:OsmC family protein n=1 Tax=Sedimenticola thiotaurini TaxID=1543721 RepID=A0A558D2V4_9GAMM|nr:OsmC family protein [Sedimenticola sp.]TVT55348.1 MAG: OsmC family protein [Sedimenticola thiotaurini]